MTTLSMVPENVNGDSYDSLTGEPVSRPMSKVAGA